MVTIDITIPVLIILGTLSFIVTLYFGNHSLNVYSFDIYVLNAFAGKLNDIDSNDLHFNALIDEYDKHYMIFKSIYDTNHEKFYPFKKLTVTKIYGKYIADYLKPYIDEKLL